MSHELEVIKEKLKRLEELSEGKFGTYTPVPESEIVTFEQKYGITLPQEYRTFLVEIGYGGTGLYTLEEGFSQIGFWDDEERPLNILQRPFRFKHAWHPIDWQTDPSQDLDTIEQLGYEGWLSIHHSGCTVHNILIISGEERGNIWSEDFGGSGGLIPRIEIDGKVTYPHVSWQEKNNHSHKHIGFYKWYTAELASWAKSQEYSFQKKQQGWT